MKARFRRGESGEESCGLCLSLSYSLVAQSDEIFARSSGVANPVHCLTRRNDVAFFSGNNQLEYVHLRQADRMEMISEGIREIRIRLEK